MTAPAPCSLVSWKPTPCDLCGWTGPRERREVNWSEAQHAWICWYCLMGPPSETREQGQGPAYTTRDRHDLAVLFPYLRKVQRAGKRMGIKEGFAWSACCPAHDDAHPSMSVAVSSTTDRLLLKCFAGCTFSQILRALYDKGYRYAR